MPVANEQIASNIKVFNLRVPAPANPKNTSLLKILRAKLALLTPLLQPLSDNKDSQSSQILIFHNYKVHSQQIVDHIRTSKSKLSSKTAKPIKAVFLNAEQSQAERILAFEKMRVLKLRCIVSTDLMSRGVDLPDVQVVINFDLPLGRGGGIGAGKAGVSWADLVHRIGRAGRFGSKAMAINFIDAEHGEDPRLSQFEERGLEDLASEISKQLANEGSVLQESGTKVEKRDDKRVAQRLRKEHKLIDRREELAEEFKDNSLTYKRRRIAAAGADSMIGQWQVVQEEAAGHTAAEEQGYQYYVEESGVDKG